MNKLVNYTSLKGHNGICDRCDYQDQLVFFFRLPKKNCCRLLRVRFFRFCCSVLRFLKASSLSQYKKHSLCNYIAIQLKSRAKSTNFPILVNPRKINLPGDFTLDLPDVDIPNMNKLPVQSFSALNHPYCNILIIVDFSTFLFFPILPLSNHLRLTKALKPGLLTYHTSFSISSTPENHFPNPFSLKLMQKASKAPHTLKSTRKSVAKTSKKPISTVISNKSTRTTTKPRTSPSFQLPTPSTFTSRKINMSTDSSPDASPELGSRIKVYTKTGDKGTAVLYTMERLPKVCQFRFL